jgi:hypothetical protein
VVDTGLFASDILSTFDKPTIDLVIPVNNAPLPTKALAYITNYFKFICIAATTTNNNHTSTFSYLTYF